MPTPQTYLVSHTNSQGTGIAQAKISETTERRAMKEFTTRYPDRVISTIGILGKE